MNVVQLNLDKAFIYQDIFNKELLSENAHIINFNSEIQRLIDEVRLFSTRKKFSKLSNLIIKEINKSNIKSPMLTFYGSGDFHHLCLPLLKLVAQNSDKKFTLIHLDNHPDWVKDPVISCGSWINEALKLDFINRIISIGICSNDLHFPEIKRANLTALQENKLIILPYRFSKTFVFKKYSDCISFKYHPHYIIWNSVEKNSIDQIINLINNYILGDYIYLTIDKDVLKNDEQITNWDQGNMSLDSVIKLLNFFKNHKNILGIDILGDYSPITYKGSFITQIYKRFEVFMDQPKIKNNLDYVSKFNERVNIKLLKTILL